MHFKNTNMISYISSHIRQYKFTIVVAIIITIISLVNDSKLPSQGIFGLKHLDKMIHVIMYMSLSYVLYLERNMKKYQNIKTHKIPNWLFLVFLIIMGGVIEIIQPMVSNRSCDLYDFLSNGVGAIFGYLLYHLTKNHLKL